MNVNEARATVAKTAEKVYSVLGEGYAESVYHAAMAIEFRKDQVPYAVENNVEVLYEGQCVGMQRLDFVIDGKIAVELKASGSIAKTHIAQTTAYMRTTKFALAMIVNFPVTEKDGPDVMVIEAGPRPVPSLDSLAA